MSRPRVSVIIIVYNGSAYLAEAIESVRAQTFPDWELLVVDDGSTDSSRAIAQRFVDADPLRIRLLAHPDGGNHGMSATRNLGLRHAVGEFVGFLDSDDVWVANKLQEQVAILDAHPSVGLVYGRTLVWHSWNGAPPSGDFYYDLGVEVDRVHPAPRLFEVLIGNQHQTPTTCNALMRVELIRHVGGFEEDFRGMFEDQIFFAKALLQQPAYVSGQPWAKYRQHGQSCSAVSAAAGQDETARLLFLRRIDGYLRKEKASPATRRIVSHAYVATWWAVSKARLRRQLHRLRAR